MSRRIDWRRRELDPQRSLSVNRRSAICGEIIARATTPASGSKRFPNAVSFSKGASAHIIQACETEFDLPDFTGVGHRGYARLLRELRALQNRLYDCTKFDKLLRYRCANLYFLVLPEELFRDSEIPIGWGALVENDGTLKLARKPIWHETTVDYHIRLLHRIAVAGTRAINRKFEITFDDIVIERCRSC
jgi:hypothetical protein